MTIDFGEALRAGRDANPASTPDILARAASSIGATDLVVYLVDFGQTVLEPMPDHSAHSEVAVTEAVATTMAGRAFTDQHVITASRDDGTRVWVPIVEGSDNTGVVAFTTLTITCFDRAATSASSPAISSLLTRGEPTSSICTAGVTR